MIIFFIIICDFEYINLFDFNLHYCLDFANSFDYCCKSNYHLLIISFKYSDFNYRLFLPVLPHFLRHPHSFILDIIVFINFFICYLVIVIYRIFVKNFLN